MDRIRKALDLARAERTKLRDDSGTAGIGLTPPPYDAKPELATVAPLSKMIRYTKTRTYVPRPDALESHRVVDPRQNDLAASAFRMLRTQVLQRMDDRGWRSMAILSPNADDGKTTTAINLAVSLAYDNRHTVLLVDCDLRHPAIAAGLDLTPEFGLNDVLNGDAKIEQCLYHPEGYDRLVVLPTRAALENSSEALSGVRGRDLVADLRERYPERIVIFDLPPLLGADDALAFLPLIECGLMVVSERMTRREDLLRCMELTGRTPILGTVLNRSSSAQSPYG
jgi:protein-tyrosine kinase